MATYNRAQFIVESLKSIKNQTFQDWECLIIDDGGTDNTQEVIEETLNEDKRFQYLKREDTYQKGLPGCRNYGLDLSKGNYIIFFDDDDIVHPLNLELCVKELENNQVSYCRYDRNVFQDKFHYLFDISKKYDTFFIDINNLEAMLKNDLPFNSCAVMWKKECFNNNKFVEHLMYAEEWELYSRILSTGIQGISIKKELFFGRKHTNSNTGEFYSNNQIRTKSYIDAILLVVKNLNKNRLLSKPILLHFVNLSYNFKKYNLFNQIIDTVDLPVYKKLKWRLFYYILPTKIYIHKLTKKYSS